MYFVVRILRKGATESHSIEQKDTLREGLARFHNIIASDLSNAEMTYCAAFLLNDRGENAVEPFYYSTELDQEGDPVYPFNYAVLRIYIANGQLSNSIEYKEYLAAQQRYFNIIAADLQNNQVSYNAALIVNAQGMILDSRSFYHEE